MYFSKAGFSIILFTNWAIAQLPTCGNDAYVAAIDAAFCGFLDFGCICPSRTFQVDLTKNVPPACNISEQSSIFSYIDAACSQLGYSTLNLLTAVTDVPITQRSSVVTTTVTTTVTSEGSQGRTTASTRASTQSETPTSPNQSSPALSTSETALSGSASSPSLSTGAKIGIGIGVPLAIIVVVAALLLGFMQGKRRAQRQVDLKFESSMMDSKPAPTEIMTIRNAGNAWPVELGNDYHPGNAYTNGR